MAWTSETFVARYPEFVPAGSLVAGALADAALMVDVNIYGALTDRAIGLYAAQILARSPFGRTLRQVEKDGNKTPYDDDLNELKMRVLPRMVVI